MIRMVDASANQQESRKAGEKVTHRGATAAFAKIAKIVYRRGQARQVF